VSSPTRHTVSLLLAPAAAAPLLAQSGRSGRLGIEAQGYPAGLIAAARFDLPVGRRGSIGVTAGYNLTDRGDFGEHDDEQGGGFGVGLLTSQRLGNGASGFYLGWRVDLWWLEIDWEDRTPTRAGTTKITVLQPTGRAGYVWSLADERVRLEAGLGLGAEVNIRTRGEAVGDGAILLGGVAVLLRL
jgi:hypothetical protein